MRAGYSIENAWREAKKDVIQQYGMESDMAVGIRPQKNQKEGNVSFVSYKHPTLPAKRVV